MNSEWAQLAHTFFPHEHAIFQSSLLSVEII
jgi:hypothetical protein